MQLMTKSEITEYLKRIKLDHVTPDLAGLMQLQEHHAENIPFENLDIVVGRKLSLKLEDLYRKVITNKRGGYCFELNILYAELLRSLGFDPKPVLGRVWLSNPKGTPPRNHLAHLVEVDGKTYVTDVGFAGLITRHPLDIHNETPVDDKDGMMRVIRFKDDQFMIQRETGKDWANQYSFENVEISDDDIMISHYYMSTHPSSHLYSHKCVGRNTSDGRIGLFNNKTTIRKGVKIVNKTKIEFGEDWLELIKKDYDLNLDFSKEEIDILFENN